MSDSSSLGYDGKSTVHGKIKNETPETLRDHPFLPVAQHRFSEHQFNDQIPVQDRDAAEAEWADFGPNSSTSDISRQLAGNRIIEVSPSVATPSADALAVEKKLEGLAGAKYIFKPQLHIVPDPHVVKDYWPDQTGPVRREHFDEYREQVENDAREMRKAFIGAKSELDEQRKRAQIAEKCLDTLSNRQQPQSNQSVAPAPNSQDTARSRVSRPRTPRLHRLQQEKGADNDQAIANERREFIWEDVPSKCLEAHVENLIFMMNVLRTLENWTVMEDVVARALVAAEKLDYPPLVGRVYFHKAILQYKTNDFWGAKENFELAKLAIGVYAEGDEVQAWHEKTERRCAYIETPLSSVFPQSSRGPNHEVVRKAPATSLVARSDSNSPTVSDDDHENVERYSNDQAILEVEDQGIREDNSDLPRFGTLPELSPTSPSEITGYEFTYEITDDGIIEHTRHVSRSEEERRDGEDRTLQKEREALCVKDRKPMDLREELQVENYQFVTPENEEQELENDLKALGSPGSKKEETRQVLKLEINQDLSEEDDAKALEKERQVFCVSNVHKVGPSRNKIALEAPVSTSESVVRLTLDPNLEQNGEHERAKGIHGQRNKKTEAVAPCNVAQQNYDWPYEGHEEPDERKRSPGFKGKAKSLQDERETSVGSTDLQWWENPVFDLELSPPKHPVAAAPTRLPEETHDSSESNASSHAESLIDFPTISEADKDRPKDHTKDQVGTMVPSGTQSSQEGLKSNAEQKPKKGWKIFDWLSGSLNKQLETDEPNQLCASRNPGDPGDVPGEGVLGNAEKNQEYVLSPSAWFSNNTKPTDENQANFQKFSMASSSSSNVDNERQCIMPESEKKQGNMKIEEAENENKSSDLKQEQKHSREENVQSISKEPQPDMKEQAKATPQGRNDPEQITQAERAAIVQIERRRCKSDDEGSTIEMAVEDKAEQVKQKPQQPLEPDHSLTISENWLVPAALRISKTNGDADEGKTKSNNDKAYSSASSPPFEEKVSTSVHVRGGFLVNDDNDEDIGPYSDLLESLALEIDQTSLAYTPLRKRLSSFRPRYHSEPSPSSIDREGDEEELEVEVEVEVEVEAVESDSDLDSPLQSLSPISVLANTVRPVWHPSVPRFSSNRGVIYSETNFSTGSII
ncbi:hypothetical protein MMC09_006794 [Bachmanniomyces sp. S44760]|nr:hypothetical protein [Bachmanniomyces sp. S44760]